MDTHALTRRMISGAFWMAATKAAGQAITWAITLVIVRLLAPQDYGLMGMATLFTGFLLLFNDLGLGAALIQDPDLDAERLSNVRSAIFWINVTLFLGLLACAPAIAAYFREPVLVNIIRSLGFTFVISAIGAPSGCMLARELAFKKKSQSELIGNVTGGVSALALATSGFGVWSLVGGHLLQQATTNALYCFHRPLKLAVRFSPSDIRRSVNFGFQVACASIFWYVSSNADFTVIGRVLGKTQLGYYAFAFQFSSIPIEKIVSIVTQVAFPSFSVLQRDDAMLRRYYLKLIETVAFLTFPMFLGIFLVADTAVKVFLPSIWLPMIEPLKILCLVSCLRALEPMNTPLVLAKGKPRIVVWNYLLQAIAMPIAFYAGARFGIQGVALAWLIAWPALYALVTWRSMRLIGLTWPAYLNALKHPAIGAAVMVAVVSVVTKSPWFPTESAVTILAVCALGCLTYLIYMALFNASILREARALVQGRTASGTMSPPDVAQDADTRTRGGLQVALESTRPEPFFADLK